MKPVMAEKRGGTATKMARERPLIQRSAGVLSGEVVFAGTRVPVQTLFDYLEEGDPLDDFLNDFPTVIREHAVKVLEAAKEGLLVRADESTP